MKKASLVLLTLNLLTSCTEPVHGPTRFYNETDVALTITCADAKAPLHLAPGQAGDLQSTAAQHRILNRETPLLIANSENVHGFEYAPFGRPRNAQPRWLCALNPWCTPRQRYEVNIVREGYKIIPRNEICKQFPCTWRRPQQGN